MNLKEEILKLKKEKNALILAHYYVEDKVQEIADFVGDSYYLSKICKERKEKLIIFCGVSFMGESAKILSPHKKIILPSVSSVCPMAEMATVDEIKKVREEYSDLAIVGYINSNSEVKKYLDVCVTSSNAKKVIESLKEKNIFFIPDRNLGRYLSTQIKNKNFIFNRGFCPIHHSLIKEEVLEMCEKYKIDLVLTHPECREEVLKVSDFIGSTSEILNFAKKSNKKRFLICTEKGILYKLKKENRDKEFFMPTEFMVCPNMKKINLENIYNALKKSDNLGINLDLETLEKAKKPLEMMHKLSEA